MASLNKELAEAARKGLQVEVGNVLKKLKSGKTLTAAERALIQSVANGEDVAAADSKAWAKSKVELANALGVTRQTIDRWGKLKRNGPPHPASNGRWSIPDWKRWMKETGRGGGVDGDSLEDELPRLNAKRILLINERLEIDNAERRGELISREDVVREAAEIATRLRSDLYGQAASICEEVMKMTDTDKAVKVYNEAVDRILLRLSKGLKVTRQRKRFADIEECDEETEARNGSAG